jgi:hypothetical protein
MPSRLAQVIEEKEGALLAGWVATQSQALDRRKDRISESELRTSSHAF